MKIAGILILIVGLALGAYSLSMEVGVDVPAKDYGYGVTSPAMKVANVDRMAQRQNFMIFSGILSVVGAILIGFASIRPRSEALPSISPDKTPPPEAPATKPAPTATSVSICPKCRYMGGGDDTSCHRCGAELAA